MYNLGDDNELDRLSSEAAGRSTHPGKPDWDKLSAELDKVLPVEEKKKRRIAFFWWLLPALLISGGVTYFMINKDEDVTAQNRITATGKENNADKKTATASTINPPTIVDKERATGNGLPANANEPLSTVEINKESVTATLKRTRNYTNQKNTFFRFPSAVVTKKIEEQGNVANVTVTPVKPIDQPAAIQQHAVNQSTQTEQPKQSTVVADNPVKATESLTPAKEEQANIPEQTPVIAESVNKSKEVNKSAVRGPGFSFELLAGVDKSTVKFTYGNAPGVNIGALIGYHFTDRLSIHTGGIYTQKNYKLAGTDFTAPKGSWASYYKLETVEGYCRMWEVPLLMRYTFSQSPKHSVFFSTGFSSYFMTSENYDYNYYFNNQLLIRNMGYHSTDTHILSIAHLSVGFENRISKSLSLQVEPYAKIPLGGVGFGNIRLSSFGLNFSVQYRQPSKK